MEVYRDNGAVGALLDVYEKVLEELRDKLSHVTEKELVTVVDSQTNDPDCRSIQTILNHLLRSGYNYTAEIRRFLGEERAYYEQESLHGASAYIEALEEMFSDCQQLFKEYPDIVLEQTAADQKIRVKWGQVYDIEQLMEHAIVHVLRHTRQIERFLLRLR